jgi:hypothetical protein
MCVLKAVRTCQRLFKDLSRTCAQKQAALRSHSRTADARISGYLRVSGYLRDIARVSAYLSRKHKIVSNEAYIRSIRILFWYKKTVMPKKKYIAARDLKDCLPNLPLKTGEKKENEIFLSRQFLCFSDFKNTNALT